MKHHVLVTLAVSTVLFGCGGGGGGSSTLPTVPLGNNLVTIRNGWTATYSVSGTVTPSGGSAKAETGTMKLTETVSGTQVTRTEQFSTNLGSYTENYIYNQATNGALTLVSHTIGGVIYTVSSTTFAIPGVWSLTTNASGSTNFVGGTSATESMAVTGTQVVTTPVATIGTYVTTATETYQGTPLQNQTVYEAPELGLYVEATGSVTGPSGTFNGTLLLQSTNIPLTI